MSQRAEQPTALDSDLESVAVIRATLERVGYDIAQQGLRADYFTSPYPHYEHLESALDSVAAPLATALRLLALAQPVAADVLQQALGREFAEAGFATNLLGYDSTRDVFSTNGATIVTRLGQYAVASANPYYPTFNPDNADVYLGPDSFTLIHHLQRLGATLPRSGQGLDLCCGSGIAGQSLAMRFPEQRWMGIDLSAHATGFARFNATLNGIADRYATAQGDLFAPVGEERFELIVCNPPFIPVPDGCTFPMYGNGGEDGLLVIRPLLAQLDRHLAEPGQAVIYAEGIGDNAEPRVLSLLRDCAERANLDITLTLMAKATIEQALYTLGVMLSRQRPSRLEAIVRWKDLFERQGTTHYFKYLVHLRRGTPGVRLVPITRLM